MGKRIATWCGIAAMGLFGALMISAPAQAQTDIEFANFQNTANWSANGESSIVDHNTVLLKGDNTSAETAALGISVNEGDEISFSYELSGDAQCTAGAPRVFVIISGVNTNSWDQLLPSGTQCGVDNKVTFVAGNAGLITTAGVVYDNGAGGTVEVSDLTVAGEAVLFMDQPEPTPTPTTEPTPEPTDTPTADPEPTVEPTDDSADKPGLPVTGSKLGWLAGGGLGLLATGAGAVALSKLRRFRLQ